MFQPIWLNLGIHTQLKVGECRSIKTKTWQCFSRDRNNCIFLQTDIIQLQLQWPVYFSSQSRVWPAGICLHPGALSVSVHSTVTQLTEIVHKEGSITAGTAKSTPGYLQRSTLVWRMKNNLYCVLHLLFIYEYVCGPAKVCVEVKGPLVGSVLLLSFYHVVPRKLNSDRQALQQTPSSTDYFSSAWMDSLKKKNSPAVGNSRLYTFLDRRSCLAKHKAIILWLVRKRLM